MHSCAGVDRCLKINALEVGEEAELDASACLKAALVSYLHHITFVGRWQ